MREVIQKIYLLIYLLNISIAAQNSVTVEEVVNEVSQSSIMDYIKRLENFGTRFCLAPNRFEVANWIKSEFESMGFEEVFLDTFEMNTAGWRNPITGAIVDTTTLQVNVVAILPGIESPERIFINGGHYDSFCGNDNPFFVAPGADDNASGTACVLESARAVMKKEFKPKSTLIFIAFGAEELGYFSDLMGSKHYAYEAKSRGDDIQLVINSDMIGFNNQKIFRAAVNVAPTENFTNIEDVINICKSFSSINFIGEGYAGADLWGFTEMGYKGIYFEENDFTTQFSLNYHKNSDIAVNIDSIFITEVIKAATGVLLSMDNALTSFGKETYLTDKFELAQNYPNPFNPKTTIKYEIPNTLNVRTGLDLHKTYSNQVLSGRDLSLQAIQVKLIVYDILGREIKTLVNEIQNPGSYEIEFYPGDLTSGVYFYKLWAGVPFINSGHPSTSSGHPSTSSGQVFDQTRKMILLR